MADFRLIQNKINGKWVISAPRRARRTNIEKAAAICPFCPGSEESEEELYRVNKSEIRNPKSETNPNNKNSKHFENSDLEKSDIVSSFDIRYSSLSKGEDWSVRVVTNKFPFAPYHEVIIHSPDHHKNWDELPVSQVELILQTYRQRFNAHKNPSTSLRAEDGAGLPAGRQVYLFHNRGHEGGESLPHPHTQLVVIPQGVKLDIAPLDQEIYECIKNPNIEIRNPKQTQNTNDTNSKRFENSDFENPKIVSSFDIRASNLDILETEHFLIFCPATSEWPDEVWIAPKQNGGGFGMIKDAEITDLSFVLSRLVGIFDLRHGHEFPFNFYIPPLKNWYLRLIPRGKVIGGFELGTNIMVNTQDPAETFNFINEHFWKPDREKIKSQHLAEYGKKV